MKEQKENIKKIVLISAKEFVPAAEQYVKGMGFEIEHYPTVKVFFENIIENTSFNENCPQKMTTGDDISDYCSLDIDQPDYFWIVEQPDDHIMSIVRPVVMLRWLGYKTPFIVSAFMDVKKMIQKYNLTGLFFDNPLSEVFLRLPFKAEELQDILKKETKISIQSDPKQLAYVVSNNELLSHDLSHEPYSDEHQLNKIAKKLVKLQILIIDNDPNFLNRVKPLIEKNKSDGIDAIQVITELFTSEKIEEKDKPDDFEFISEKKVDNLCDEHTDLQCILLDWKLTEENNPTVKILERIKNKRPNLPVYMLTSMQEGYGIAEKCKGLYDDFLTKKALEEKTEDTLSKIVARFDERRSTPFWTEFKKYVIDNSDSWHTPGHSRGASFRNSPYLNDFYNFWGKNTFAGDLSVSVEHLGSLLDSTEFVGKAQDKAKDTFGTKHTFFATNGSSTSNKIMLQSIIKPNNKVIVDRNCHKSVHYACIQAGANVVYLESEFSEEFGIFAPPTLDEIEKKLVANPETKVLVITGCTYDGLLINMKKLVQLVRDFNNEDKKRERNVKLFIDEAWFAYAGFHPHYADYSAVRNKADYITHSTHKVLSAFSQASYLHINDEDFDEDFFREIYYIYTSTSPQYQMIASLDVASMQMEMEGYKLVKRTIKLAKEFAENVNKNLNDSIVVLDKAKLLKSFNIHSNPDNIGHDPLKITLDIRKLRKSKDEILEFLRNEAKIEIEKSTFATITVLFTIGVEEEKISRLYSALVKLANENMDISQRLANKTENLVNEFVEEVNKMNNIKASKVEDSFESFNKFEGSKYTGSGVLNINIVIQSIYEQEEILNFLRHESKLEMDVLDSEIITILFRMGVEKEKINCLYSALEELNEGKEIKYKIPKIDMGCRIPYKDFYSQKAKKVTLSALKKQIEDDKTKKYIAARLVTPYPPGIPLLVPGQKIEIEHLTYLESQLQDGVEVHGCHKNKNKKYELCVIINDNNK